MRYFLDTEFIEHPCTIDLISIALICEDGSEFYAESTEVNWPMATQWVIDNVRPHLKYDFIDRHRFFLQIEDNISMAAPKYDIGQKLLDWIGPDPEFWAYFADYDWVAFCWLFGSMIDLPADYPKFCRDVKQFAVDNGVYQLPVQESTEHCALDDARWTQEAYEYVRGQKEWREALDAAHGPN